MEGGYRWHQIEGVQVFIQRPIQSRAGYVPVVEELLSLVDSMSPAMRFALVNEGVPFDELSAHQQDLLSPVWKGHRGLARQVLIRSSDTRIKISFQPSVIYQDSRGYDFFLPLRTDGVDGRSSAPEPVSDEPVRNTLEQHSPGSLDFGRGSTMTVLDIVLKASSAFGVRYSIDPRIANAEFFISGSMDQTAWEEVLPVMTDTEPGKRSFSNFDATGGVVGEITALLLELAQNPDEALHTHMNGGRIKASELQGMHPSLVSRFEHLGISPNASLELNYGVSLEVQIPGYRTVTMPNGTEAQVTNATSFFFGRR